jgi:outer membrane immunogenic protein
MKKLLVAGIAAAAFCGAPVLAADMPVKTPMATPYDPWTGCYIGGNVGEVRANSTSTITNFVGPVNPDIPLGTLKVDGLAYGGQIGCDYQFNNNWVVGIRGMWDRSNKEKSDPQANSLSSDSYKMESFGTAVGKVGYLINPNLQLYGLGGVAWIRNSINWIQFAGAEIATTTQNRTGYDIGVGLSWMFARNWNLWVEYDHMSFGTKNLGLTGVGAGAGDPFAANFKQSVDTVLVGIDYRFNWGKSPVVAKY